MDAIKSEVDNLVLIDLVESMIAGRERDGDETYRDLAARIVRAITSAELHEVSERKRVALLRGYSSL